MKYRNDIQMLRGLAVLFVVLYHLGLEHMNSGFLGVDIFFVISGFLMSAIYPKGGAYEFFLKRAVRLLPSYYTVVFITLVTTATLCSLNEIRQVASQTVFSSLFSSNLGFWTRNSYFSQEDFSPLLHLWSLGVEIQFYLLVPLIVYFGSKAKGLLFCLTICSLLACLSVMVISPKTAFFLTPLRLWQFMVGYLIAHHLCQEGNVAYKHLSHIGSIALLALFIIPLYPVDGSAQSLLYGHPSTAAILVTISTGIVLAFGLPKLMVNNSVSDAFSILGKYSYSLYLVHFPIIVLFNYEALSGTQTKVDSWADLALVLSITGACTYLLHHAIEKRKFHFKKPFTVVFSMTVVLIFISITLPVLTQRHTDPNVVNILNAFEDRSTYRCGKLNRLLHPSARSCELKANSDKNNTHVMLVGNSHADSIKTVFATAAERYGVGLHFLVPNNPLMPGGMTPEEIVGESILHGVSTIYLHFSPSAIYIDKIRNLVERSSENDIDVVFIDPVPTWNLHIPKAMYKTKLGLKSDLSQTKNDYLEKYGMIFQDLNSFDFSNFSRVRIVDAFCNPECMYSSKNDKPLYFDSGHLTLTGSSVLRDTFLELMSKVSKNPSE
jgi:peptidoglycan/LPS O-acetylase OafA/YrhL